MTKMAHLPISSILLVAFGSMAHAETPSSEFLDYDNIPYLPGDRQMPAKIQLNSPDNSSSIEVWVIYHDNIDYLQNRHLDDEIPMGKAKLESVDSKGVAKYTFIFPHRDHPAPNKQDKNPYIYHSGAKLYYKWAMRRPNDKEWKESGVVDFRLPDKLSIVNFGDSYSSGEGAPNKNPPLWENEQCHRSANSGQAKAVAKLKRDYPDTAIAFKNVACSGAEIDEGVIRSQKKRTFFQDADFPTLVPPQVDQARRWLSENHYDKLNIAMFSIGGNDVNFGGAVQHFLIEPGNLVSNDKKAENMRTQIATGIAQLPTAYDALKNDMDLSFDYDSVLVTAYPDPLRSQDKSFCGDSERNYGGCWGFIEKLNSQDEFKYGYTNILTPLDEAIKNKVNSYDNWRFVGGVLNADAQKHGLCNCQEPYFNTIGASMASQNSNTEPLDPHGTMHPNRSGHENLYLPPVYKALKDELLRIRTVYARERAIEAAKQKSEKQAREVAVEKAKEESKNKQLEMRAKQSNYSMLVTSKLDSIPKAATARSLIPGELLGKIQEKTSNISFVDNAPDSRQPDDYEPRPKDVSETIGKNLTSPGPTLIIHTP